MKNIIGLLVGTVLYIPLSLSAEMAIIEDMQRGDIQLLGGIQTLYVNYKCPAGWSKVFDITNDKSKWVEIAPVLICKPQDQVMKCPQGTYFYVSGNDQIASSGEIGCMTPVW